MNKQLSLDEAAMLGAVLRQRRDAIRLSRDKLAQMVNLSPSRIQQYERGWHRQYGNKILSVPPAAMLEKLGAALNTTAFDLLAEADLHEAIELPSVRTPDHTPAADKVRHSILAAQNGADRVSLRVDVALATWQRFLDTLTPEGKTELLMLFTNVETSTSQ